MTTKFGVFTETRSHAADPYIDATKTDARQHGLNFKVPVSKAGMPPAIVIPACKTCSLTQQASSAYLVVPKLAQCSACHDAAQSTTPRTDHVLLTEFVACIMAH